MALSAGGLALYFSFIGKAPFVVSIKLIGIIVVWSWILSLCLAAVGHKLLGNMVIALNNLSSEISRIKALESLPDEVEKEVSTSVQPHAIVEKAKAKLSEAEKEFDMTSRAFEQTFFPMQNKVSVLVKSSLIAMIIGFGAIGVGYSVWVISL